MNHDVNILGIQFSGLTLKETVGLICNTIEESRNKTYHIITVNPEIAVQIQEDPELKKISLEADLITPDGVGIVWASRLKGKPLAERVTGYDLLLESLDVGNQKGWSFYLFGADEAVSKNMAEYVSKTFPNIIVAGRHHGYFTEKEELQILEEIEKSKPDILIIALGSPLTDKWIYKYKDRISAKVTFGVGGSLDVVTGKVKPTPTVWKKLNLEWLHRRIIDPSRKQRQKRLKVFAYKAIIEELNRRRNKHS